MPSYSQYKRFLSVLDVDDVEWITVKGNHIPIKKGENKEEAIKSFFENKSSERGQKSPEIKQSVSKGSVSPEKAKNPSVKKWRYPAVDFSKKGAEEKFIEETYPRVKKVLSKAYFEEPDITNDLKSIKGIKFHGLDHRRKSKSSAVGKINRERIENPDKQDVSDRTIMSKMYDLVRYTQVVDKDNFVEQAQKTIDTLKKKGYKVVQLKNFWLPEVNKGGAYRGINMKWMSPKGQKFEYQFNTENNIEIKDVKMHKLYEERRNLDPNKESDRAKIEKLDKEMAEVAKGFDNPKGIEKLKK